jgi:hypothetical protein
MNHRESSLLLIATNNQGKIEELQALLKETGIKLITPAQIHLGRKGCCLRSNQWPGCPGR